MQHFIYLHCLIYDRLSLETICMRKLPVFFLVSVALYLFSCSKKNNACGYQDDNVVAPGAEQQIIKAYLDSAGISANLNASGFYYQIISTGSNATPNLCSSVTVTYKGQLMSGKIFDQQNNVLFTLGSLIDGWKKGLPLIKNGGEIKLFIPPTLGYGSNSVNTPTDTIPPNSVLIFDINLLNVQ